MPRTKKTTLYISYFKKEENTLLFFKLIEKNQETKLRCSPLDSYSIS